MTRGRWLSTALVLSAPRLARAESGGRTGAATAERRLRAHAVAADRGLALADRVAAARIAVAAAGGRARGGAAARQGHGERHAGARGRGAVALHQRAEGRG